MEILIGIVVGILWHISDKSKWFDDEIDWEKVKKDLLKD